MDTVRKPTTNEELKDMLDAMATPETKPAGGDTDIAKQEREDAEAFAYHRLMLRGMQKMRNIYAGTVDPVTVQNRRRKNKAARKQRRVNRLRSK